MTLCERVCALATFIQPWTARWALASQTNALLPTNRYLAGQVRPSSQGYRRTCSSHRRLSIPCTTTTRERNEPRLGLRMPRPPIATQATPATAPASTSDTIHTITTLSRTCLPSLSIPRPPPSTLELAPLQAAASLRASSCPSPQSLQTAPSSPLHSKGSLPPRLIKPSST